MTLMGVGLSAIMNLILLHGWSGTKAMQRNHFNQPVNRNLNRQNLRLSGFCLLASLLIFSPGCAKNHSYIDPNGNVVTVGHQPFWGPKQVHQQAVVVSPIPTHVDGAKIVASAPSSNSNTVVGVVNPAIPEAVVVNQQAPVAGSSEPGLTVTGANATSNAAPADAPPTQISGGINRSATRND